MDDPRERAIQILTVYFRRLVADGGYAWTERNDRHMEELVDCLIDAADGDGDRQRIAAAFARELDPPAYTRETIRQTRPLSPDDDPQYQAWLRQREATNGRFPMSPQYQAWLRQREAAEGSDPRREP